MTLHRKWFDQIASGIKTEEYREFKEYWYNKLVDRNYDVIVFRNGYAKDSPVMQIDYNGVYLKTITWDSGITEEVFALKLGKIHWIKNYGKQTIETEVKQWRANQR